MSTIVEPPTPPPPLVEVNSAVPRNFNHFYVLCKLEKDFYKAKPKTVGNEIRMFKPTKFHIVADEKNLKLWKKSEQLYYMYEHRNDKFVDQYEYVKEESPNYVIREKETNLLYPVKQVIALGDNRLEVTLPKKVKGHKDPTEVPIGERTIWKYGYKIPYDIEAYCKNLRRETRYMGL